MVIVQGTIRLADPADRDAYLAAGIAGMTHARGETGCMEFVTAADPAEPDRVVLSERWETMEDLNEHTRALNRRRRDATTTVAGASGPARPVVVSSEILIYHVASVQVPTGRAAAAGRPNDATDSTEG